jgi:carbon-monoxide dehydrogenase medium subunit
MNNSLHREGDSMPQKPAAYFRPTNLDEALRLLKKPNTVPLAGGTTLLATEEGIDTAVVDLQDLGLNTIEWAKAEDAMVLAVGSMTRLADLDEALGERPAADGPTALLRQAIRRAGPNTYRHAATIGGIITARLPDSELLAALLALGAWVVLAGDELETLDLDLYEGVEGSAGANAPASEGVVIPLYAYLRDPGIKALLTAVRIEWQPGRGQIERVARTPADDPIVSVALWWPDGRRPSLAATGIAPLPVPLSGVEAALARGNIDEAADAARAAAAHPGDFRGDAAYRAEMAAVLTRRVLKEE